MNSSGAYMILIHVNQYQITQLFYLHSMFHNQILLLLLVHLMFKDQQYKINLQLIINHTF